MMKTLKRPATPSFPVERCSDCWIELFVKQFIAGVYLES